MNCFTIERLASLVLSFSTIPDLESEFNFSLIRSGPVVAFAGSVLLVADYFSTGWSEYEGNWIVFFRQRVC
jgi:hypothetical protein